MNHGPQRRDPDPACDHEHVPSAAGFDRPALPKRPAQAHTISDGQPVDRERHTPDVPDRVLEHTRIIGIRADRDRRLPHAGQIDHVELPGGEPESPLRPRIHQLEFIRGGICRFGGALDDPGPRRDHGPA